MNIDTGEIRPWASLTDAERKSGRWIALPETDENGQPVSARYDREAAMRQFFKDDNAIDEELNPTNDPEDGEE